MKLAEILMNKRAIIRSIARTFVDKKVEIVSILKKYNISVSKQPTNRELLNHVLDGFETSESFRNDFARLLLVNGSIRNIINNKQFSNTVGSVLISLADTIKDIFSKEDAQNQLLQDIDEYEKQKEAKTQSRGVFWVIGIVLIVGGLAFWTFRKK